jgi:cell division protein FtsX
MAGATRGFIRSAFVVEGMLVALIGWLVAVVLVWFAFRLILAGLTWNAFTMTLKELAVFFPPRLLGSSLAVILALGAISSHLSVNHVLRSIEP